ncbi:CobW family GTP-binding protein [Ruegeria marina]|uniref:GTPase, G3E family n=1 Tax=Ruegeria marina TaxID=639004 RepID=A0A1G7F3P7_9RHOB|nr:CobW family GTP-binding protein [Ruegeria marina]SDE70534.1 GTPase, G3E family [Ruegeria marina]
MKLPVTVISGYLGAGKTTLINHLLRNANGMRLAVLVNEFGALSIDEDLIEAEEEGLMSITGGCVCCAFGGDMIGVLEDMRDSKPGFDHVLLEASGVALPGSIMTTVGLVDGVRPDASLVLADADQVERNAADKYLSDTVLRQLEQADILLITKTDLVSAEKLSQVEDWLKTQAPHARTLRAERGAVPLEAVVGTTPLAGRRSSEPMAKSAFASTVLYPDGPVHAENLARALADTDAITRAKGYVKTDEGLALIHVVGQRYEVEAADGLHDIGVVCIGAKAVFDAEFVQSLVQTKP